MQCSKPKIVFCNLLSQRKLLALLGIAAYVTVYRVYPITSLFLTLVCQTGGFLVAAWFSAQVSTAAWLPPLLHAAVAVGLGRFVRLAWPWQVVNLAVPLVLSLELPPNFLLAGFVLLALLHLPALWSGVPYYPTSKLMYSEVAEYLPKDRPFKFVDLGSGFGGLLYYLSRTRPNGDYLGVEIGPLPLMASRLRFWLSRRVRIRAQSLWRVNLGEFDVVYAFLAPGPMPKLWEKVKREMKPGGIFLTNTFQVSAAAHESRQVSDERECTLFVHRV